MADTKSKDIRKGVKDQLALIDTGSSDPRKERRVRKAIIRMDGEESKDKLLRLCWKTIKDLEESAELMTTWGLDELRDCVVTLIQNKADLPETSANGPTVAKLVARLKGIAKSTDWWITEQAKKFAVDQLTRNLGQTLPAEEDPEEVERVALIAKLQAGEITDMREFDVALEAAVREHQKLKAKEDAAQ